MRLLNEALMQLARVSLPIVTVLVILVCLSAAFRVNDGPNTLV
jgi:hypothetical protein